MRLDALSRVKCQEITEVEAAGLMGLSLRQAPRVWKNFRACGHEMKYSRHPVFKSVASVPSIFADSRPAQWDCLLFCHRQFQKV